MKQLLSIAGVGLLGGFAIASWMPGTGSAAKQSTPSIVQAASFAEPIPVAGATPQFQTVSDWRDRDDDYRRDWRRRDSYRNQQVYRGNSSYGYNNGYYSSRYPYNDRYHDRRSTGESVAIVGGSAAAGAAIGGLAKGGKGAAVGAIAGGIGGLIYDRATKHKHR